MAGGQIQFASLGFNETHVDEEEHEVILETFSDRLASMFSEEGDA
jgi:hypothetical protein